MVITDIVTVSIASGVEGREVKVHLAKYGKIDDRKKW
jgi:hypothetical protein